MWDIDGPYHGEPCAATHHPGHKGLDDSQWQQWKVFREWLAELMAHNQYLPIPEWNFLTGQSVTSMGYREAAAGLPANLQLLLYRQYIYDGTWYKTPTMGWIEFNVGKLQPLHKHLQEYERWLVQGLGCGAKINWRGPGHFYDTEQTKSLVKGWFDWFGRHREILTSDIIHLARPSGRDLDVIFHVNPMLEERGLFVVFNPLDKPVKRQLDLPLYYTGISDTALISVHADSSDAGVQKSCALSRDYRVQVPIEVPAQGHIWLLIKDATPSPRPPAKPARLPLRSNRLHGQPPPPQLIPRRPRRISRNRPFNRSGPFVNRFVGKQSHRLSQSKTPTGRWTFYQLVAKSLSQNCLGSLQRPGIFELPNGFGTCSKSQST